MPHRSLLSPAHEVVEVPPHPLLRPGVRLYRGLRVEFDRPRKRLELPVGCATLLLGFDHRIRVGPVEDGAEAAASTRTFTSLFAGMRTRAVVGEHTGSVHGIEVVMHPWAAYAMFGISMHELAEALVDPSDFAGARIGRLTDRLAELPDWPARFAVLDATLMRWQASGPGVAPRVLRAWELMVDSGGGIPIGLLAADLGWSERQLERRFREQLGVAPKSAARVLRLQRALRLLIAGRPFAEIAARAGFYDQSHLNREVRTVTGLTPGGFLDRKSATPAGPSRLDGMVTTLLLSPSGPTLSASPGQA
ncbi:helix-turn-helix domain-containing protein [Embleya sp. NBC_00896]|uniref:AraC family transcriptional regulator n=1 Tax=Embleya sp. NBC_00896 TaxID=2975961 RepID=UPI002F90C2B3|nr:helix-turn-helix domain-containing protein [Embleya sp. NBC_00896]